MPENNSYDDFGKHLGTLVSQPFVTSISRRCLARDFHNQKGLNLTDSVYHRNSKLEKAILKTTFDNETKAKMFFIARNHSKRREPLSGGDARISKPTTSMRQKRGRGRPPKKTRRARNGNSTQTLSPLYHLSVRNFLINTANTTKKPISKTILYENFSRLDDSKSKEVFNMVSKSVVQTILESDEDIVMKAKLCFMSGEKISESLETQLKQHGDLQLNDERQVMQFLSGDGIVVFEVNMENRRRRNTEENEPMEEDENAGDLNDTNDNGMPVGINFDVQDIEQNAEMMRDNDFVPPGRCVKIEVPSDSEEGNDWADRTQNRIGQRMKTAEERANTASNPSTSTGLREPKVEDPTTTALKVPKVEDSDSTGLRAPKVGDSEDAVAAKNDLEKKSTPSISTTGLKVPKIEEP
ncbi:hypothetical protein GCK72_025283 [Caenorhabditis remanei]|uniref:SPK domain-containing protein n=1 Tax=Caenorhabditis remanei TaxID=31234 RepID=A0A6A5G1J4_CAERE|nr:hypothetical protein GCK72_025283 [Caenorhabditis remanei]KAF1748816.1 hypothetical protein GCK72_025283 [Caenorhabditis remanei]